jgi:hypothetical protein
MTPPWQSSDTVLPFIWLLYIASSQHFINSKAECLEGVKCVPSAERPSPGKLGYYIGGHTGTEVESKKTARRLKKRQIFSVFTLKRIRNIYSQIPNSATTEYTE